MTLFVKSLDDLGTYKLKKRSCDVSRQKCCNQSAPVPFPEAGAEKFNATVRELQHLYETTIEISDCH